MTSRLRNPIRHDLTGGLTGESTAGQVAADATQDIAGQTRQVLAAMDRFLAEGGSDKSGFLMAQIFLADMKDFDGMNAVWDGWVSHDSKPSRATVNAQLAKPEWRLEIVVSTAAKRTE